LKMILLRNDVDETSKRRKECAFYVLSVWD
jgi:hypothetical protein